MAVGEWEAGEGVALVAPLPRFLLHAGVRKVSGMPQLVQLFHRRSPAQPRVPPDPV